METSNGRLFSRFWCIREGCKVQTAIILNCAGPQVLEVYDNVVWENPEDKHKPKKVLEALEKYCNPRGNEVLESQRFWNTPYQEPFDKFLTELKTRAASCNFQDKDRMMRAKIVFTVTGKLQELLLRVDSLTLENAVKVCRAYEQSTKQVKEFKDNSHPSNSATKVNKVAQKPTPRVPRTKKSESGNRHAKKDNEGMKINCNFCGYEHEKNREKCPAWGKTCDKCKGRNHFKSKCKKVHAISQSQDGNENYDDQWLMAVSHKEESINATLTVNDHPVRFQLDSAADVNTILVKGEAVVIPQALRPSIARRLHSAHLGRDSMLCRARGTVYWPNMTSDIKQTRNT